jgi:hypothetical protein
MYLEWDETRMQALCARWGIDYLQRGTMQRPMVVRLSSPDVRHGFAEARQNWNEKKEAPAPVNAGLEDFPWLEEELK